MRLDRLDALQLAVHAARERAVALQQGADAGPGAKLQALEGLERVPIRVDLRGPLRAETGHRHGRRVEIGRALAVPDEDAPVPVDLAFGLGERRERCEEDGQ